MQTRRAWSYPTTKTGQWSNYYSISSNCYTPRTTQGSQTTSATCGSGYNGNIYSQRDSYCQFDDRQPIQWTSWDETGRNCTLAKKRTTYTVDLGWAYNMVFGTDRNCGSLTVVERSPSRFVYTNFNDTQCLSLAYVIIGGASNCGVSYTRLFIPQLDVEVPNGPAFYNFGGNFSVMAVIPFCG